MPSELETRRNSLPLEYQTVAIAYIKHGCKPNILFTRLVELQAEFTKITNDNQIITHLLPSIGQISKNLPLPEIKATLEQLRSDYNQAALSFIESGEDENSEAFLRLTQIEVDFNEIVDASADRLITNKLPLIEQAASQQLQSNMAILSNNIARAQQRRSQLIQPSQGALTPGQQLSHGGLFSRPSTPVARVAESATPTVATPPTSRSPSPL